MPSSWLRRAPVHKVAIMRITDAAERCKEEENIGSGFVYWLLLEASFGPDTFIEVQLSAFLCFNFFLRSM